MYVVFVKYMLYIDIKYTVWHESTFTIHKWWIVTFMFLMIYDMKREENLYMRQV